MVAEVIFEGRNRTGGAFAAIDGSLSKLGGKFGKLNTLAKGFTTILAAGALGRAIGNAVNFADKIAKLNTRLGASTEFLSEMQFVVEQNGVSFDTFATGLQRVQRRISEAAHGSGEASGALRELGLNAKQLAQLSLEDQFLVVAESLSKLESEGDRTRLAMKLFDTEGVALVQTMGNGAAGIEELRQKAQALGLTLSGEAAAGAAEAKDKIGELKGAFNGLVRELALNFGPGLSAVTNFIAGSIPKALAFARAGFSQFASLVADSLAFVIDKMGTFATAVSKAMEFFHLPGAGTLKAAGANLTGFAETLGSFADKSTDTAAAQLKLAIAVTKVGEAAADTQGRIDDLVESVSTASADAIRPDYVISNAVARAWDETTRQARDSQSELSGIIGGAIEAGASEGAAGMVRVLLNRLTSNFLNQAADLISGALGGGGGVLGALFGIQKRAAGGFTSSGSAYVVGERQPELFVPSRSGFIIAGGTGGGGGGMTFNIDARGAAPGTARELKQVIEAAVATAIGQTRELQRRRR